MNTTKSKDEDNGETEHQLAPEMAVPGRALPVGVDRRAATAAEQTGRKTAEPSRPKKGNSDTKAGMVLKLLRRAKGVSLTELTDATGWQAHSVRGFLSGTVKKKLGLILMSEKSNDGQRRYRVDPKAEAR